MIKKEKILYSYLSNIIEDESPNTIFVNTTRDISKLIKKIKPIVMNISATLNINQ